MNLFTRLSNGWDITLNSFKVLKENRADDDHKLCIQLLKGFEMKLSEQWHKQKVKSFGDIKMT